MMASVPRAIRPVLSDARTIATTYHGITATRSIHQNAPRPIGLKSCRLRLATVRSANSMVKKTVSTVSIVALCDGGITRQDRSSIATSCTPIASATTIANASAPLDDIGSSRKTARRRRQLFERTARRRSAYCSARSW